MEHNLYVRQNIAALVEEAVKFKLPQAPITVGNCGEHVYLSINCSIDDWLDCGSFLMGVIWGIEHVLNRDTRTVFET